MRERWVDHGNGILTIETNTIHVRLRSQARKNYRNTQSNWRLFFSCKGQYGYACVFSYDFGGAFDEALERVETIVKEMFESIRELI